MEKASQGKKKKIKSDLPTMQLFSIVLDRISLPEEAESKHYTT